MRLRPPHPLQEGASRTQASGCPVPAVVTRAPLCPPPSGAGRSWAPEAGGPWHPGGGDGLASGGLDPGRPGDCEQGRWSRGRRSESIQVSMRQRGANDEVGGGGPG